MFGYGCAVFMQSDIVNFQRQGWAPEEILAGLAQSGRGGTGAEVDRALRHSTALVKTGTAPCTHARRAPGDGFVIAMLPANHPEILLMVRVHGTPGSHAARIAGEMLGRVE